MIYISQENTILPALPNYAILDEASKKVSLMKKNAGIGFIDDMFWPAFLDDLGDDLKSTAEKAKKKIVSLQASIPLMGASIGSGLLIVFGIPGSGKSYFVDTVLHRKYYIIKWNDSGSSLFEDTFSALLYRMSDALTGQPCVAVDSVKKLSIAISDNLGKGGFSRKVLLMAESMDSVARYLGVSICWVINPMDMTSEVISTWISGLQSVASSIVVNVSPTVKAISVRPGFAGNEAIPGTPKREYLINSNGVAGECVSHSTLMSMLGLGKGFDRSTPFSSSERINVDMKDLEVSDIPGPALNLPIINGKEGPFDSKFAQFKRGKKK